MTCDLKYIFFLMNAQAYIAKMKNIQGALLELLDNIEYSDSDLQQFTKMITDQNVQDEMLKDFLHLLSKMSADHQRSPHLIKKVEYILAFLKKEIISKFSNTSLFNIFKKNKRILLFLIKERFIEIDEYLHDFMSDHNDYIDYFAPELISYMSNEARNEEEDDLFEENRRIGENHNYICKLIRDDSVKEFISHVNKANLPIKKAQIQQSCFETNWFLINQFEISLMEYAAFFGSLKIFKYLYLNDENITDSIWQYAIHGNNAEIIHLLEEKLDMNPEYSLYYALLFHNYEIADYLINNYDLNEFCNSDSIQFYMMKNYNFKFLNEKYILDSNLNESLIFLSKYNYIDLVKLLLSNKDINKVVFTDNYYPIHCAISNGNIEFVKFLLKFPIIKANLNAILYLSNLI